MGPPHHTAAEPAGLREQDEQPCRPRSDRRFVTRAGVGEICQRLEVFKRGCRPLSRTLSSIRRQPAICASVCRSPPLTPSHRENHIAKDREPQRFTNGTLCGPNFRSCGDALALRRDFIFMGQEPRLPAGVPGCVPGAVGREPQGSGMARETDPPLEKAAFKLSVPRAAESSVVGIVRLTDRSSRSDSMLMTLALRGQRLRSSSQTALASPF